MKSYLLLMTIFCSVTLTTPLFSQDFDVLSESMQDAFNEMDNERISLRFNNAIDGSPIAGGFVKIENIGAIETNKEGIVSFEIPADGYYKITFLKSGYITTEQEIDIKAGTIFSNRFSISPKLDINNFRVVLDWGKKPLDLDAHFVEKENYHISYRNMKALSDNRGQLDIDDRNGYGPETITVSKISKSQEYIYFVKDFSNLDKSTSELSKSKAVVKVYGDGELKKVYSIPKNVKGDTWNVFRIINGNIIDINKISKK